jgi:Carboxypeptidase regulatory-like domain
MARQRRANISAVHGDIDWEQSLMAERLVAFVGSRFALLLALVVTGCGGSERANVTGKLTHRDGSPLVGARVIATSGDTGASVYGNTDGYGAFELSIPEEDGVPPGSYEVVVIEDRGDMDNRVKPTIASKYRNASTSGISFSVESGESENLELTLDAR